MRVADEDVAKMTSVTVYGAFKLLVMPFGLTNAPATLLHIDEPGFTTLTSSWLFIWMILLFIVSP